MEGVRDMEGEPVEVRDGERKSRSEKATRRMFVQRQDKKMRRLEENQDSSW
jgi:hypothetical protein